MFAVLKTGGKQYKVARGDTLRVERLAAEPGETVQFDSVLMLGGDETYLGAPEIGGAAVRAEVLDQLKGPKVLNFVKRRRKHGSKRTKGHRQNLTLVRVTDILESGAGDSDVKRAVGTGKAGVAPAGRKAAVKGAAASAAQASGQADGTGRESEDVPGTRPGNLLDQPRDGQADDLKKLSGLGAKMEEALNGLGIFHFDQIAAWSDAEVAYMDAQPDVRGRIGREAWRDQARSMAAGKE